MQIAASAIQSESVTPMLKMDSVKGDLSLDLKWLYTNNGSHGMLEGGDFARLDMVFPVFELFVDQTNGKEHDYQ